MLEILNQFIVRCSFSLGRFALLFVGFAGTLQTLMFIGDKFQPHAADALPFDLQNSLTAGEIFSQLANYNQQAYTLYYTFTTIDYFFPLFAGLFLATLWAYILRSTLPHWYEIALQKNLLLLLLIPTLFDWLENISLLTVIVAFPSELRGVAEAAVIAKQIKLATTYLAQGSTLLIMLAGVAIKVKNRLSH